MSAADHLSPRQLAMFMPAHQIFKDVGLGDINPEGYYEGTQTPGQKKDLLEQKEADTEIRQKERGVTYDLDNPGPLTIYHGTADYPDRGEATVLWDGHHRLANAMLNGKPDTEFPIEHVDDKILW